MDLFEGMYGTSRSSYLPMMLPEGGKGARMIVRHSARIDDRKPGARGRCIENIFIENPQGERFLFPTQNLAPARVMTQHLNHGGTFADGVGAAIMRMAQDYAALGSCSKFAFVNSAALPEQAQTIREACRCKMRKMRKTFEKMCRPAGYKAEAERMAEMANALIEGEDEASKAPSKQRMREMRKMLTAGARRADDAMCEAACRAMDEANDDNEMTEGRRIVLGPTVKVLGRDVDAEAWRHLADGKLALIHEPKEEDLIPRRYTSKSLETLDKLRVLVPLVRDDSMLNLLSHIADRMGEERDPETLRKMRIIAAHALKAAGMLDVPETSKAVKEFASWLGKLSTKAIFCESIDGADVFNVRAFADEFARENDLSADNRTFARSDLIAALKAERGDEAESLAPRVVERLRQLGYTEGRVLNEEKPDDMGEEWVHEYTTRDVTGDLVPDMCREYGLKSVRKIPSPDPDVKPTVVYQDRDDTMRMVCSPIYDAGNGQHEIVSVYKKDGADEAVAESAELSREDILLPSGDQTDSFRREVTKPTVFDPATGDEEQPNAGYVDRLRALAGVDKLAR